MASATPRWRRIERLFEAALEHTAAERQAYLDEACGGDGALRREVDLLLAADGVAEGFLDRPAPGVGLLCDPETASTDLEPPESAGALEPGMVLAGRFRIARFLAAGGMGEVYEAEDLELGERVALKTLGDKLAGQGDAAARFRREVQLARRVTHPSVCRIFDIFHHRPQEGEDGAMPEVDFLTMELLAGENLRERLRRDGPLAPEAALPILGQIAAGLEAAHELGIVHRDLKSANVLLVERGGETRAVVTDFGLARLSWLDRSTEDDPRSSLSGTGAILGTPESLAPEQLTGGEVTPAVDVYAFGVLTYEMVTGHFPFAGDPLTQAYQRLELEPTPPSRYVPELDRRWEKAILRCLRRRPAERFGGCAEVIAFLRGEAPGPVGWRPTAGEAIPGRPNWVIERQLGQGALSPRGDQGGETLGTVWLALHPKTGERRVFKFGYDEAAVQSLRREITVFRLLKGELGEREDIRRILDWSLEEEPYYVEAAYTADGDLVEWAQRHGSLADVKLETRLEIVAQVATALSAAHSVGVLHKDVKPKNVLVTEGDGDVRIELADFGIGDVTDRGLLARAGITALGLTETPGRGSASSGTPLYMAPEVLEGKPATVRADVYALGVVLYQMAVGDFTRVLAPGWQRDVGDELLVEDIAESVDGSPEERLGDALRLAERLRNLDKRRRRREAERREQAEAKRLREAAIRWRRRRRSLTAAVAVLLLFTAAMGVMAWRVSREAERANQEAAVAEQVSDFLVDIFKVPDPVDNLGGELRGDRVSVREVLEYGASKLDDELGDQPRVHARLLSVMGDVYFNLGEMDRGETLVDRALGIRTELLEDDHPELGETLYTKATLLQRRGEYDEALKLYRRALAIQDHHLGADHPEALGTRYAIAMLTQSLDRHSEAEVALRDLLPKVRRAFGARSSHAADILGTLAQVLGYQGRYDEAMGYALEALEYNLEQLSPDHQQVGESRSILAGLLTSAGRYDEAEHHFELALEIAATTFGGPHLDLIAPLSNLANNYYQQGRYAEAEGRYRESYELALRFLGARHDWTGRILTKLGRVRIAQRDCEGGVPHLHEAREVFRRALGEGHWRSSYADAIEATCLISRGDYEAAEASLVESYEEVKAGTAVGSTYSRDVLKRLIALYEEWGRPEQAARYRGSLETKRKNARP